MAASSKLSQAVNLLNVAISFIPQAQEAYTLAVSLGAAIDGLVNGGQDISLEQLQAAELQTADLLTLFKKDVGEA